MFDTEVMMVCVGIDLGTTNSLVGVYEESGSRLLPNALGAFLTPSVVGLADDKKTLLIGQAAQKRLLRHPKFTCALFKRQMGSGSTFQMGSRVFNATELSAMVLSSLKNDAEEALKQTVTEAIISVPAYFNAIQRQATKDAAEIAGLKVRRLINEPTAAALASGVLDRKAESLFVVLDLGGGTFDVSILEVFEGVMEVRSSAGDSFLGGEDFTVEVAKQFANEAGLKWGKASATERELLISVSEQIKRALGTSNSGSTSAALKGKEQQFSLTVDQFNEITAPLLARLRRPIEKCLYDCGISTDEIDRIILVGGATRMPSIRSMAAKVFRKLPERNIDPDQAIALGTAVQAGLVERNTGLDDIVFTDVSPFSMGIETSDNRDDKTLHGVFSPIIERNTVLPASRNRVFSTMANRQTKINVKVYQGEAAMAADNILLGEFVVSVPPKPAGHEAIDVRFTYDVSGLLAIDIKVVSTGTVVSEVVDQLAEAMPESKKMARLKEMEKFKKSPREEEVNIALTEHIKYLHELLLGEDREFMLSLLHRFEVVLAAQDPRAIAKERLEIAEIIAEIEANYVR